MFESRNSAGATENYQGGRNLTQKLSRRHTIRKFMRKRCVERSCEVAKEKDRAVVQNLLAWMTIIFKKEELESVGELSKVCSQIVLTCLYLPPIGRLDIHWSVNEFARAVTKWTRACDRRFARLISYIHHTNDYRQYCHVGKTRLNIVEWVFSKTQTLLATLRIQN